MGRMLGVVVLAGIIFALVINFVFTERFGVWIRTHDEGGAYVYEYEGCRITSESDGTGIIGMAVDPDWRGKPLTHFVWLHRVNKQERTEHFFKDYKGESVKRDDGYDVFKEKCLPFTGELPEETKRFLAIGYAVPSSRETREK